MNENASVHEQLWGAMPPVCVKPVRVPGGPPGAGPVLLAQSLLTSLITAVDFTSLALCFVPGNFWVHLAYIQTAFFPMLQKYLEQKRKGSHKGRCQPI